MTMLNELQLPGVPESVVRDAKRALAKAFWERYDWNGDEVLLTLKIRWFTATVTLREIRMWFITIPLKRLWVVTFGGRSEGLN